MTRSFPTAHLRARSDLSLGEGVMRPAQIAELCALRGIEAACVSDIATMASYPEIYAALSARGVKPLCGVTVPIGRVAPEAESPRIGLIAEDEVGRMQILRIASEVQFRRSSHAMLTLEDVASFAHDRIFVLNGASDSPVGHALGTGGAKPCDMALEEGYRLFGHRMVAEVLRSDLEPNRALEHRVLSFASDKGIMAVGTVEAACAELQDLELIALNCAIQMNHSAFDQAAEKLGAGARDLCTAEELKRRFEDLPELVTNASALAVMCSAPLEKGEAVMPRVPSLEGSGQTEAQVLRDLVFQGFTQRFEHLSDAEREPYVERMEMELGVIEQTGFPGYFLIVADICQWARAQSIPVGPGRGSAAGSLVAYALSVTDIDPLKYGLLFERFLNPHRQSLPDIDIDFCARRRDRVIEYLTQTYGAASVCRISVISRMASRAALQNVARVLGLGGLGHRLSLAVPMNGQIPSSLAEAQNSDEFQKIVDGNAEAAQLVNFAVRLENCARAFSSHPGGVVITPVEAMTLVPMTGTREEPVCQYTIDGISMLNLVKFDILSVKVLTQLYDAVRESEVAAEADAAWVKGRPAWDGVIAGTVLDDDETWEYIGKGQAEGIFQLEGGMNRYARILQPKTLPELTAINALYRPGPLRSGYVSSYVDVALGRKDVELPLPELGSILEETHGVFVYQEQVMLMAREIAGYDMAEADDLRRAMAKKDKDKMARVKREFIQRSVAQGHDEHAVEKLFDSVEGFAEYAFNKPHSVAYALLSYQTAFAKHHYPEFYLAELLNHSADAEDGSKIAMEARRFEIELVLPSVTTSQVRHRALSRRAIACSLGMIHGSKNMWCEQIIEARERTGGFDSLSSFIAKSASLGSTGGQEFSRFIEVGALDDLMVGSDAALVERIDARARALAAADQLTARNSELVERSRTGQTSLMEGGDTDDEAEMQEVLPPLGELPIPSVWQSLLVQKKLLSHMTWGAHDPLEDVRAMTGLPGTLPTEQRIQPMTILIQMGSLVRSDATRRGRAIVNPTTDVTLEFQNNAPRGAKPGDLLLVKGTYRPSSNGDQRDARVDVERIGEIHDLERSAWVTIVVDQQSAGTPREGVHPKRADFSAALSAIDAMTDANDGWNVAIQIIGREKVVLMAAERMYIRRDIAALWDLRFFDAVRDVKVQFDVTEPSELSLLVSL